MNLEKVIEQKPSPEVEKLAALFAQAPVPMAILVGPTHIFSFVNSSYENLVDRKNLVGKSVVHALPEIASQGIIELLDQVYQEEKRFEAKERAIEFRKSTGGGTTSHYLNFSYDPLKNEDGKVIGIMVVAVDVSAQVEAKKLSDRAKATLEIERENFQKLLFQTNEIFSIMSGPKHIFEFVNPAHVRLLGRDLTGFSAPEVMPEASAMNEILDRVYRTGMTVQYRELSVMIGKDEHFFDFVYSARRNAQGEIDGVLGLGADVTERVLTEKRLEKEKELERLRREMSQKQFDWLGSVFDRLPFLVFLIEPRTGRAIYANQMAKWLYGSDVIEKDLSRRYSNILEITDANGNQLPFSEVPSARAARGEIIKDVEVILKTTQGQFNLLASTEIVPAMGSREESMLVIAQDITAIRNAESEKLRASQMAEAERRKLQQIFEQAPVGITIVTGPDHVFETVNESYRKMIGDEREYLQRKFIDVFPESVSQGILAILDHSFRTGEPYHGVALPVLLKNENGIELQRHYDFLMQALYEADGSIGGLITIVLDVSDQMAAKSSTLLQQQKILESEARFRQLANSMPQIVWTARPDGILNYTNLRWTAYSGSSEPEKWLDFVHPDDVEAAVQTWKNSIELGIPYEVEFRLIRKSDNSARWHLVRAVQVKDAEGKILNWFGTCTDIQDQKETQAELILAKANAEAANLAKTSFLANMSHEIRTPLGVILGFTDLLVNSNLGEQERKHLDVIVRSGKTLTRLIDDILDISKIEAGKMLVENIQFFS